MGRSSYSSRRILEETTCITLADLSHDGFLKLNTEGLIIISGGGLIIGNIRISIVIRSLHEGESYIEFNYNLDGDLIENKHYIEHFTCHFGNYRYYFLCRECCKRVTALYLYKGYFACRHCHKLVYLVSRKHRSHFYHYKRSEYLYKKAEKLKEYGHPKKAFKIFITAYKFSTRGFSDLDKHIKKMDSKFI